MHDRGAILTRAGRGSPSINAIGRRRTGCGTITAQASISMVNRVARKSFLIDANLTVSFKHQHQLGCVPIKASLTWNAKRRALSKWGGTMKPPSSSSQATPEASDRRRSETFTPVIGFLRARRALALAVLWATRWKWKLCSAKATTASVCQDKWLGNGTALPTARRRCFEFGRWYRKARQSRWKHDEKAAPESDRVETQLKGIPRPLIRAARTSTHTHSRRSLPFQRVKRLQRKTWKKKLRVARSWIIGAVAQTRPADDADSFWRVSGEEKDFWLSVKSKLHSATTWFGVRNNFRPETAGRFRFPRSRALVNGARD